MRIGKTCFGYKYTHYIYTAGNFYLVDKFTLSYLPYFKKNVKSKMENSPEKIMHFFHQTRDSRA